MRQRVMCKDGAAWKPRETMLADKFDNATGLLSDTERNQFGEALSRSPQKERPKLVEYLKKLNTKEECENQFSFVWQSLLKACNPRCAAEVLEQVMAWSRLDAERKIDLPNPVTAILLDPSLVADDDNCDY